MHNRSPVAPMRSPRKPLFEMRHAGAIGGSSCSIMCWPEKEGHVFPSDVGTLCREEELAVGILHQQVPTPTRHPHCHTPLELPMRIRTRSCHAAGSHEFGTIICSMHVSVWRGAVCTSGKDVADVPNMSTFGARQRLAHCSSAYCSSSFSIGRHSFNQ